MSKYDLVRVDDDVFVVMLPGRIFWFSKGGLVF